MLIDAPPTLLNTIIHKKHLSHFMAKTMNELAHKSPLIVISFFVVEIFRFSYYANLFTADIIGCASTVV